MAGFQNYLHLMYGLPNGWVMSTPNPYPEIGSGDAFKDKKRKWENKDYQSVEEELYAREIIRKEYELKTAKTEEEKERIRVKLQRLREEEELIILLLSH